ncbi:hypothetical protein BGZ58_009344 [Dissophora ornata]|nr:hypothetical protein BGZ58_009344 [Dissophora ornata]
MDDSPQQQNNATQSNQGEQGAQAPPPPQEVEAGYDESSEWETESSESEGSDEGSDEDSDESGSHDLDDMDDEDFIEEDLIGFNDLAGIHINQPADVEALTTQIRANRRQNIEDDTWSEFSGDEKYEPKDNYDPEPGEGHRDMYDNANDLFLHNSVDNGQLTLLIRQLMLKLTKGRKERERKLKIGTWREGVSAAMSSPTSPSSSLTSGAYLHRLMVRGPNHPQELEHSPAYTFHRQCANSLTVTPSAMGVWDDIYTISRTSIMRCGVLDKMTESLYHSRLMMSLGNEVFSVADCVSKPNAGKLKMLKATKFLKNSIYQFDHLPPSEDYVLIEESESPLCLAHRYGYLAMGTDDGGLQVYCTESGGGPIMIHDGALSGSPNHDMLNSIQIVRWPRYSRNRTAMDEEGCDAGDIQGISEESDDEDEKCDEQEGYPKDPGHFDHYLIMTRNGSDLLVAALPDHIDVKRKGKYDDGYDTDEDTHDFLHKKHHTWIRNGFGGVALNDARASPNGRWIAVVGDAAKVWTIEVTHVPETEEQRIAREKKEYEDETNEQETDSNWGSEYECSSDDPTSETEPELNTADDNKASRGEKRPRDMDDDRPSNFLKSPKPTQPPRMLRQYGHPVEMRIPAKVLYQASPKPNHRWRAHAGSYASQYLSWNATSTKFAHSSDHSHHVVVWSMPSREIVCCVDTGGVSFGIEFHPKLENLFAVCNWYGFVHVVDVTGCCVGDEELVPSDAHYNGQTQGGPGLAGCEGPHYEEKHDILMLSFRGERDKSLRILDSIRGLGWSTDGRHLYVATTRRVLQFELADDQVRIPSLFQLCARAVREWKERTLDQKHTKESDAKIKEAFKSMPKEWEYVPYFVKRRIWGDLFLMRSHDG